MAEQLALLGCFPSTDSSAFVGCDVATLIIYFLITKYYKSTFAVHSVCTALIFCILLFKSYKLQWHTKTDRNKST